LSTINYSAEKQVFGIKSPKFGQRMGFSDSHNPSLCSLSKTHNTAKKKKKKNKQQKKKKKKKNKNKENKRGHNL
jgi:hypothetical protein